MKNLNQKKKQLEKLINYLKRAILLKFTLPDIWVDIMIKFQTGEIYIRISKQLNKFGIKYHKLFISKPSADIYVDDKAFGYNKSWIEKY